MDQREHDQHDDGVERVFAQCFGQTAVRVQELRERRSRRRPPAARRPHEPAPLERVAHALREQPVQRHENNVRGCGNGATHASVTTTKVASSVHLIFRIVIGSVRIRRGPGSRCQE
jgi:hypothetical protein